MRFSDKAHQNFLVITDLHLDPATHHRMELSPKHSNRNNELDKDSFLKFMATLHDQIDKGLIPKPDFMLILGDLVSHGFFYSRPVVESQTMVFQAFKHDFPQTPVFFMPLATMIPC